MLQEFQKTMTQNLSSLLEYIYIFHKALDAPFLLCSLPYKFMAKFLDIMVKVQSF